MQSTPEEQPTTVPEKIVETPTKVETTIPPGLETVDHEVVAPTETESEDIPKAVEGLGGTVPQVVSTTSGLLKTVAAPAPEAAAPTA